MKCYKENCLDPVKWFIFVDPTGYVCEAHAGAIGSYIEPLCEHKWKHKVCGKDPIKECMKCGYREHVR